MSRPCSPSSHDFQRVNLPGTAASVWIDDSLGVCAPGVSAAELDALRQRQLGRVIDRVRLPPHVTLPGIAPAFAAAAGFFLPAKRAPDLGPARAGVDVRDAAIAPDRADKFLRLAHVIGEN